MNIREEIPNDVSAIRALTKKAFEKVAFLLVTQTTTHALVLKIIQAWLIRA